MMLSTGLGTFTQQTGRGAYTGPATLAEWDALDAYVSAELAALRSMGLNPSAEAYHPTITGGTGPHHAGDAQNTGEGAYYQWQITLDRVKYPGYVRLETVERYKDYAGGDPAQAAAAAVRDAESENIMRAYYASQAANTSTPASDSTGSNVKYTNPTPSQLVVNNNPPSSTASSVITSAINSVAGSEVVSPSVLASVPTWVWIAGAAAAAWMFFGRNK